MKEEKKKEKSLLIEVELLYLLFEKNSHKTIFILAYYFLCVKVI